MSLNCKLRTRQIITYAKSFNNICSRLELYFLCHLFNLLFWFLSHLNIYGNPREFFIFFKCSARVHPAIWNGKQTKRGNKIMLWASEETTSWKRKSQEFTAVVDNFHEPPPSSRLKINEILVANSSVDFPLNDFWILFFLLRTIQRIPR